MPPNQDLWSCHLPKGDLFQRLKGPSARQDLLHFEAVAPLRMSSPQRPRFRFTFRDEDDTVSDVSTVVHGALWDLDGTLLDTETLSDYANLLALRHPPFEVELLSFPWDIKKKILGMRGNEWAPIVLKELGLPQEHWETLWMSWEANLNALCPSVEPLDGALEVVSAFKELGLPQAIATSSRAAAVEIKRKRHEALFEPMVSVISGDMVNLSSCEFCGQAVFSQ